MDENTIKAAVLNRIRRQARGKILPVVTSEFSFNGTGIRADLVVLDRDFYGVEIKGSGDTLRRLPDQVEGYARYCDRTVLVVDSKHVRGLRDINLHGAEVWRYDALWDWEQRSQGERRHTSGHWLLQLLTVEEERRAVRQIEQKVATQPQLIDAAQREAFEEAFRHRYARTSDAFWQAVKGRPIRADDIPQLSRFFESRQRARAAAIQTDAMWTDWALQMSALTGR